jgi:DNA-directed RNA polymerase subunit F
VDENIMKSHEIINENWLQLIKATNMLRNATKFKHLPDETIEKMAHKVVDKWNNPVTKTVAKKKPGKVSDLTKKYKKDRVDMADDEFEKFYGFPKHSINEHRMVWKSTKKGPKLAWRCTSGFRANRTVPDARDCGKPLDFAQSQRMKVTRRRTSKAQARKAKKTKKVNPISKLIRKLNKKR